MYSPRGRTGRTPGGAGPLVAALALALMGTGGVALAAPKGDPGPPEHAQGNGPAPPAQANGQPPQAEDVAPAPKAKAKGPDRAGGPGELPPQAGGNGDPGSVNHGQAPGEVRGQGLTRSKAGRANGCQAARCQGGAPQPSGPQPSGDASGGGEQPQHVGGAQGPAAGDVPGVSDPTRARPDDDRAGTPNGESESGDSPELGSVQGLNQGGGEEAYRARGTFDGALPFTGFELALLAAMGALLAVAGVWVRSTA